MGGLAISRRMKATGQVRFMVIKATFANNSGAVHDGVCPYSGKLPMPSIYIQIHPIK